MRAHVLQGEQGEVDGADREDSWPPSTVDPGRSRGGVREHIYARHISVGGDPSPGHDGPVGVGVFHLSTGFRILIRVLIGINPAAAPGKKLTATIVAPDRAPTFPRRAQDLCLLVV